MLSTSGACRQLLEHLVSGVIRIVARLAETSMCWDDRQQQPSSRTFSCSFDRLALAAFRLTPSRVSSQSAERERADPTTGKQTEIKTRTVAGHGIIHSSTVRMSMWGEGLCISGHRS